MTNTMSCETVTGSVQWFTGVRVSKYWVFFGGPSVKDSSTRGSTLGFPVFGISNPKP